MATSSFKVESGIQLLARLSNKQGIENFYPTLFSSGPKHGDTIEFTSNEILTPLIIDIVCTALLPKCLNGHETGVIIFNSSGHFNFNTLLEFLQEKITLQYETHSDNSVLLNKEKIEELLKKSLNNLFILEIFDATQFYATIYNLENILMECPNITLLFFDTISAFYWSEQTFKITKIDTYLKKVLNKIQKVTKEHRVILMYNRPDYFCSGKESLEQLNYRIHITHTTGGVYQADIKTNKILTKKKFCKVNNQIKWI